MYVVVNKRRDLEHAEALKAMMEKEMVFLAGVPESTCLGTARRANTRGIYKVHHLYRLRSSSNPTFISGFLILLIENEIK